MTSLIHTYQTRLALDELADTAFNEMAKLFSKVQRTLFADIMAGAQPSELKSKYLIRFQITARQFNACRVSIEGLIASRKQLQILQIAELKSKIEVLEKLILSLERKTRSSHTLFLKKRRVRNFKGKLSQLEADRKNGIVRICFGTKKLFHAQFHLEASGFHSFEEWKTEWEHSRSNAFFFMGSKDETAGNQTCAASIQEDGKLTLRIRLPDATALSCGKYLVIPNILFKYGQQEILRSLDACRHRKELHSLKNLKYKDHGQAISYRFVKDKKGWRVFVTTPLLKPAWETSTKEGILGVDINVDHLAVVETDRFGNLIAKHTLPLNLYGKTSAQSLALIGDACAEVVQLAKKSKKDLVLENLNFQKKKLELKELGKANYRRMLSSFAYDGIIRTLKSRAYRCGVHLNQVNPAFTSLLGRIKFAKRYGLSVHHSAALCIGRRLLGFSERPPRHLKDIPDGKGGYVTLSAPVRKRTKHVWSFLRAINRKLQVALAAHFRTVLNRSSDPNTRSVRQKLSDFAGEIPARESSTALLS